MEQLYPVTIAVIFIGFGFIGFLVGMNVKSNKEMKKAQDEFMKNLKDKNK